MNTKILLRRYNLETIQFREEEKLFGDTPVFNIGNYLNVKR